eukprot:TRINITY_DN102536_c0_g1_i1.p1 TRINITY_DN102536_c0_g1~~TRINITY_DN102536_c0_g1_i1.p1  ORF type:complete len:444 (-),score=90.67 TRINITY_DN102536_c0_g1_i1:18-1316(-)
MARQQSDHRRVKNKRGLDAAKVKEEEVTSLIVECKYRNELPLPPVPKLLRALPSLAKLCQYRPTSLELDHKPFLLSESELMSRVEIVDPDAYGEVPAAGSMRPPLPPADAQLLKDDDLPEEVRDAMAKRRRLSEATEAWHRQAFGLQLPQLITNDVFTERQRFTTGLNATEKKMHREPPGFKSVDELAEKIEKTFEAAEEAPVHPTKPSLKAKRILPIVPDAVLWSNKYVQIFFDEPPPSHEIARHDLLFRSNPDPRTTCFSFFMPGAEEEAGEAGAYKLAQSYIWDNRGAFSKSSDIGEGDAVLLSTPLEDDDAQEIRFLPVPTFMKLKKLQSQRLDIEQELQSLNVSYREPTNQETIDDQERMAAVLSEEATRERSEASLDFVEGEWQIRGDPRSSSGRSRQQSSMHDQSQRGSSAPLPLTASASPAPRT